MTTIQKVETAEDLFKINNSLTLQSKIRLAIFGLVLAPLRLVVLMLITSFIYTSSRLGLLFTNPEVRSRTQIRQRTVKKNFRLEI